MKNFQQYFLDLENSFSIDVSEMYINVLDESFEMKYKYEYIPGFNNFSEEKKKEIISKDHLVDMGKKRILLEKDDLKILCEFIISKAISAVENKKVWSNFLKKLNHNTGVTQDEFCTRMCINIHLGKWYYRLVIDPVIENCKPYHKEFKGITIIASSKKDIVLSRKDPELHLNSDTHFNFDDCKLSPDIIEKIETLDASFIDSYKGDIVFYPKKGIPVVNVDY